MGSRQCSEGPPRPRNPDAVAPFGAAPEGEPMTKRHLLFASAVLALVLGRSVGFASAKPLGTISVTDSTTAAASAGMTSHFTASGCGFRANDDNYYLVVRGPGLYTSSLTYWTDHFPVGANGCGSASPTWSGSGVTGNFDV